MIAAKVRLSQRLNIPRPWGWVLNRKFPAVFAIMVCVSPGMMEVNDVLWVHGHFVPLNAQWLSALFDVALGLAVAILATMLKWFPADQFPGWLRRRWVQAIPVLLATVVAVWHVYQERTSIPTLERRFGFNSIYHNILLYPFLGYALGFLLIAAVTMLFHGGWRSPVYCFCLALVLALIVSWIWAGTFDGAHQYAPDGTPKSDLANPAHPWHNGLIPQFFRWLDVWVQRLF